MKDGEGKVRDRPLHGKLALVTGASRGIGAAIAERLAQDGADIALHYGQHAAEATEIAALCTRHGVQALTFQADLAVIAEAEGAVALFSQVREKIGVPAILVNNAGTGRFTPIADITPAELLEVLAVNTASPLLLAREAARHMLPGGRIVNIGSVITSMPVPLRAVYAASKGAVDAMTAVLAQELGPKGITINTVAPGVTATDRFKTGDAGRAAEITTRTALGRIGEPADIAAIVAWLCGPNAAWVTGEVIRASGGLRGL